MLFPLRYNVESDYAQHSSVVNNSEVITEEVPQVSDEFVSESLENQPVYQGPVTCSCAKALMKANLLMDSHFKVDNNFVAQSVWGHHWFINLFRTYIHRWFPNFV